MAPLCVKIGKHVTNSNTELDQNPTPQISEEVSVKVVGEEEHNASSADVAACGLTASTDPEGGAPLEWRPIGSCTVGPDEWVWAISGKIPFVAAWDEEDGWYTFNLHYERDPRTGRLTKKFEPTHWMPLPESPAVAEGAGS